MEYLIYVETLLAWDYFFPPVFCPWLVQLKYTKLQGTGHIVTHIKSILELSHNLA